jgi:hypothetical protein
MSKVFTSKQFIEKLKWLTTIPNVYYSGSNWSKLNSKGQWQFDCVLSIKSILWGFKGDKNKFRGGTVYKSNGVADFSCNGGLNYCTDVSTNFSKLVPGEYLCMKDSKYNHSGIYLGDGKVFEDTTGWGTGKAIISEIDSKGNRYYKGVKNVAKWTYHGKLKYIDYQVIINQVMLWQEKMNEQWQCGLAVDGHFGPMCTKEGMKHILSLGVKAPIMVKWLQKRLIELGYSVGKSGIDGSFGYDTQAAVKNFQKAKGLKVDGRVGSATYKALTE